MFSEDPVAMVSAGRKRACRIHVVWTAQTWNLDIVREMAKVLSIPICPRG